MTEKTWLTRDEAAHYVGLSKSFLEILARQGGGPAFYRPTPKTIRYAKADLDAWLMKLRTNGENETN